MIRMKRASVLSLLLLLPVAAAAQDGGRVARPKLVVICAVDQLATWVFDAARPHFAADGGFRRLLDQGVAFPNCAYLHGCTETGPGHATIATGATAAVHGIVKNEWYDPAVGGKVYCVADAAAAAVAGMPEGKERSPARLLVPTVGDLLKQRFPDSRIVSVSHKDRSAILMGGKRASAVVWIENSTGRFVTNATWGERAPDWLVALDATRPADQWFGWTWDRFAGPAAYEGLDDDRSFEAPHATTGKHTLPAKLTGGRRDEPSSVFYLELYASPASNELVLQAALAGLRGEQLGQQQRRDGAADLLCVSFSATDLVGHYFGPDSVEARDTLLRLDALLGRLLSVLDDEVGVGRYAFVLTADHGVAQPPEVAKARGLGGGRGLLHTLAKAAAEKDLRAHFGADGGEPFVRYCGEFSLYLDHDRIAACATDGDTAKALDQACAVAAAACAKVRGIARGISVPELLASGQGDQAAADPILTAVRQSICPARSGDVVFVVEPYWLEAGLPASHGTPYPYDREVPLLAMGPGLRRGATSAAAVSPGLAAVLAARWLGIDRPAAAADEVPADAFLR
jgi:Type I phosphodiesterase / nucleotide pyrophosphatase